MEKWVKVMIQKEIQRDNENKKKVFKVISNKRNSMIHYFSY